MLLKICNFMGGGVELLKGFMTGFGGLESGGDLIVIFLYFVCTEIFLDSRTF